MQWSHQIILLWLLVVEQHTLSNINNGLNTHIYSYLETSGAQISNLYLNVHFFNTSVNGKEATVNRALDGSTYPS